MDRGFPDEAKMSGETTIKFFRCGNYIAEIEVQLIEDEPGKPGWGLTCPMTTPSSSKGCGRLCDRVTSRLLPARQRSITSNRWRRSELCDSLGAVRALMGSGLI